MVSKLVFEVDTTAIDSARASLEALESALARAKAGISEVRVEPLPAQVGCFAIDPLESAISSIAQLIADERDRLHSAGLPNGQLIDVLGAQLDRLLSIQIECLACELRIDPEQVRASALHNTYGLRRRGA